MKTVNVFLINEHPEPEKVFEWIRANWHDLAQHNVDEAIDTLKAFADWHGVNVDYSISAVPDRGEYIRFSDTVNFNLKPKDWEQLPLTGVFWDCVVFRAESASDLESDLLESIHKETEYIYSDEGLRDMCEANEYHFFEGGSVA